MTYLYRNCVAGSDRYPPAARAVLQHEPEAPFKGRRKEQEFQIITNFQPVNACSEQTIAVMIRASGTEAFAAGSLAGDVEYRKHVVKAWLRGPLRTPLSGLVDQLLLFEHCAIVGTGAGFAPSLSLFLAVVDAWIKDDNEKRTLFL